MIPHPSHTLFALSEIFADASRDGLLLGPESVRCVGSMLSRCAVSAARLEAIADAQGAPVRPVFPVEMLDGGLS